MYYITTATFNTPFAALGQSPEGCSSFMFPRIMGEDTAKKVLGEGFRRLTKSGKRSIESGCSDVRHNKMGKMQWIMILTT